METWFIYGLLIAVFFGTSAIAAKVATSEKFYGMSPGVSSLLMLAGIAVVFIGATIYQGKIEMPKNLAGMVFGVLSGILWALGFSLLFIAVSKGADVAKLAPIVGTNILITVVLGIVLLKEVPNAADMAKTVAGALLVVIGSALLL
jgi:uncharacterized membrane protein